MTILQKLRAVSEAECEPMRKAELGEVEMDVQQIVADDRQTYDHRLAYFYPIDPR
jgi:hypothetical protein